MRFPTSNHIWAGVAALTILTGSRASAQWAPNGTRVFADYSHSGQLLSDSGGGAFVYAMGYPSPMLSHLNGFGVPTPGWAPSGITIPYSPTDGNADVTSWFQSADGGCTLALRSYLANTSCFRYSSNGQLRPGWPRTNLDARRVSIVEKVFPLACDRTLVIVGSELTSLGYPTGLRALSLEADGSTTPGWPDSGNVVLAKSVGTDSVLYVGDGLRCPDGSSWLAITKLSFNRLTPNVNSFIIRFKPDGTVDSSFGGGHLVFAASPACPLDIRLVPDGTGGFLCAWVDERSAPTVTLGDQLLTYLDVYATRITGDGHVAPGWPATGFPVCIWSGEQHYPQAAPDEHGGVFVIWSPTGPGGNTVHIQHLSGNGAIASGWPVNGKAAFARFADFPMSVATDGMGGAFVVAETYDPLGYAYVDAQHFSTRGDLDNSWSAQGYMVDNTARTERYGPGTGEAHALLPSAPGSAIVAWSRSSGIDTVYAQKLVVGGVVATDVALVSSDASPDHVSLQWLASGDRVGSCAVERCAAGGPWVTLASAAPDGQGHVAYEDRQVAAGASYDYRLSWPSGSSRAYSSVTTIHVPLRATFALAGARPNPASSRDCWVAYSLAKPGPATLELFDVRGRRVAKLDVGASGVGEHVAIFGRMQGAGPGLYWVRLQQGERSATARIVVTQ